MKRRSKLFLLISGIIFLCGVVLCLVGMGVASSTGEQLFATKKGDDRYYTYSFGDGETDKIKISVTDADVNIFGGAENTYIELVNFNENNSSYSANGATVSFTETAEIKDITGFWESGIGFKGLRYVFTSGGSGGEKAVNIYVADEEYVKNVEIKIGRGNVEISGFESATDYSVTLESGKIKLSELITTKSLIINAKGDVSTNIIFDKVSASQTEINAKRAKLSAGIFQTDSCDINVAHGSAAMTFVPENEIYTVDISTKGKLEADGSLYTDTYSFSNEPENSGEDNKKGEKDDEEKVKISALNISGEDFSVTLDTPAEDIIQTEDTAQ